MRGPVQSIKDKVTHYLSLRFEQVRLEVIERIVTVMGYFVFLIIAIFFAFLLIMFLFLALAEMFNVMFNSYALGYLCTAGVVLILFGVVFVANKAIIRFFAGKLAWLLTKPKANEKDDIDGD
ncbi:MAG: hypothetical protein QM642_05515 [Edaphocola sp.]